MTILYVQKCCTHLELEHLYPRLPVAALAGDGGDVGPVEQVHNIHQRQGLHRAVGAVKTRIAPNNRPPTTSATRPTWKVSGGTVRANNSNRDLSDSAFAVEAGEICRPHKQFCEALLNTIPGGSGRGGEDWRPEVQSVLSCCMVYSLHGLPAERRSCRSRPPPRPPDRCCCTCTSASLLFNTTNLRRAEHSTIPPPHSHSEASSRLFSEDRMNSSDWFSAYVSRLQR